MLGSNDCFNFEFFLPFDQVRGRFRIVRAIDFVFLVGHKLTSMEDVVNVLPAVSLKLIVPMVLIISNGPKHLGLSFSEG